MWVDAALADELELVEPLEHRRRDLCALADQDEGLGVLQTLRQDIDVVHMVGPDLDLMTVELPEARKRAQRVEIVVEDRDLHALARAAISAWPAPVSST